MPPQRPAHPLQWSACSPDPKDRSHAPESCLSVESTCTPRWCPCCPLRCPPFAGWPWTAASAHCPQYSRSGIWPPDCWSRAPCRWRSRRPLARDSDRPSRCVSPKSTGALMRPPHRSTLNSRRPSRRPGHRLQRKCSCDTRKYRYRPDCYRPICRGDRLREKRLVGISFGI